MADVRGNLTTPVGGNSGRFTIKGEIFTNLSTGTTTNGKWFNHNVFVLPIGGKFNDPLFNGSIIFNDNNTLFTFVNKVQTYVGTWDPSSKFDYQYTNRMMNGFRKAINTREDELFRVHGSNYDSFNSNFQDTMLAGVFVAMLGTTVLFYTFRQL